MNTLLLLQYRLPNSIEGTKVWLRGWAAVKIINPLTIKHLYDVVSAHGDQALLTWVADAVNGRGTTPAAEAIYRKFTDVKHIDYFNSLLPKRMRRIYEGRNKPLF